MENLTISVIIPCYNTNISLLNRTIESILRQTYQYFEIIIINDGSDDEYTETYNNDLIIDERIKIINQENKGVSSARNRGIDNANGDYITFVDADDEITPVFFEDAIKYINKYSVDIVIGGNLYTKSNTNRNFEEYDFHLYEKDKGTIEVLKSELISVDSSIRFANGGYIGRGPVARVVKTDVVKNIKFRTNLSVGEDLVWNQELLQYCTRVAVVEKIWYIYYINDNSATKKINLNIVSALEDELNILANLIDLDNEIMYKVFCEHIFDEIFKAYECCLTRNNAMLNSYERKMIKKNIFSNSPWNYVGTKRYFRIAKSKQLLKVLLYRTRLIFAYYDMKSR